MRVIALVAHSFDGFIARNSTEFTDWSSKEDKKLFAEETKKAGVIIVGNTTFKTFKSPLKNRLNIVLTSTPNAFQSIRNQVEYTNTPPKKLLAQLKQRGYQSAFVIGGASVYTLFLKNKLLEEIWLTLEPIIFGQGLPNFTESIYDTHCLLIEAKKLNDNSLHLRYKVKYE